MTLTEVKDWLKTQIDCPYWYMGKIDASKEQSIGLYNARGRGTPNIAIGGLVNTSYTSKAVTVLVHWGKTPSIAEVKAQEVYDCMFGQSATIGDKRIIQFNMSTPQPVNVGTDDNGIYEYVIEVNIIHER